MVRHAISSKNFSMLLERSPRHKNAGTLVKALISSSFEIFFVCQTQQVKDVQYAENGKHDTSI
jgi:hypothetical protein